MNLKKLSASALILAMSSGYFANAIAGDLVIESWRTEDKGLWTDIVIPAFNKKHPGINVTFSPTKNTDYPPAMNSRFQGGTAGDLVTCKPFAGAANWINKGYLEGLEGQAGLEHFSDLAKSAWTKDGVTYCLPMASVMHGFFYNKDAFKELGLSVPTTEAEFFDVLESIENEGSYQPIALGTQDKWEAQEVVYSGVGPNYWNGEEGRQGIIDGSKKFTDKAFVDAWNYIGKWRDYMGRGFEAQGYTDSQTLFTLGRAAIYPGGSWEIAGFNAGIDGDFELGAFYPPVRKAGDQCYIANEIDMGMGINASSDNKEEAAIFLAWLASAEFAEILTNEMTGFFSLSTHSVNVEDPAAAAIATWPQQCESTIRVHNVPFDGIVSAMYDAAAEVINGTTSAEQASRNVQAVVDGQ